MGFFLEPVRVVYTIYHPSKQMIPLRSLTSVEKTLWSPLKVNTYFKSYVRLVVEHISLEYIANEQISCPLAFRVTFSE